MILRSSILDTILNDLVTDPEETGLRKLATEESGDSDVDRFLDRKSSSQTRDDWRNRGGRALVEGGVLEEAQARIAGSKNSSQVDLKTLSEQEVKGKIKDMLHLGKRPNEVAEELTKMAELYGFQRGLATDVLKDMAGVVGYLYLEPNHFNDTCENSLQKIESSGGKVIAKSVKKISKCDGCTSCHGAHCSLYKLPIIASSEDLSVLAKKETGKFGKQANRSNLTYLHNGAREEVGVKRLSAVTPSRASGFENIQRVKEDLLTRAHVAVRVEQESLLDVYTSSAKHYGKVAAKKAVAGYLGSLKEEKSRIDTTKVPCGLLKGKLACSNPLVGNSKCASCSYRSSMHCGYTGGTLLMFPGMDRVTSSHKQAANPSDGNQILADFELKKPTQLDDIDTNEVQFDTVEPSGSLTLE